MTIRKPDPIEIFMIVVAAWLLLAMFTGCSSAKELIDKAERKDPTAVAEYARQKYPCTDLLRPDTVTVTQDSVVFIDCPEQPYEVTSTDTVRLPGGISTRTVRVPVTLPVQTRYITKWFEDSAKIKIAAFELGKLQTANDKLTKDLASMTSSRAWFRKWFWILVFIAGGLTVWTVRKLFI